jgi:hypothetical protein
MDRNKSCSHHVKILKVEWMYHMSGTIQGRPIMLNNSGPQLLNLKLKWTINNGSEMKMDLNIGRIWGISSQTGVYSKDLILMVVDLKCLISIAYFLLFPYKFANSSLIFYFRCFQFVCYIIF